MLELQKIFEELETDRFTNRNSISLNKPKAPVFKLPVIVFSCNRRTVKRCLDGLIKYRPDPEKFPIIVSQDCAHSATAKVIQSYGDEVIHIQVILFSKWIFIYISLHERIAWFQHPDQSEPEVPAKELKFKGYFKISRHYSWGLRQIFRTFNHTAVIIVEGISYQGLIQTCSFIHI